jgi:dihydroneopterin aldolase / 2-amino-4-hydroxy-6-hydroxymethyldihydropteridine diphosphokinase
MKAWLCLGSNQSQPFQQLEKAVQFLDEKCYITILQKGKAIETKPYGYKEQPDFANQLLEIETKLSASELLLLIKNTEKELGRTHTFKWGPRVIDIDVLFYGDETINSEQITIPHPGIMDREYLLMMLNDVIPDYTHPALKQSISKLYNNLKKET